MTEELAKALKEQHKHVYQQAKSIAEDVQDGTIQASTTAGRLLIHIASIERLGELIQQALASSQK